MMKTIIFSVLLTYSLTATAPLTTSAGAAATYRCASVSSSSDYTTNVTCASCFAWSTTARARDSTATNVCSATLSTGLIGDCESYNGYQSNTLSTSYPNATSCVKCKKTYYNVSQTTSGGNFSGACSDSKGTGCTDKVSGCQQSVCYSAYSTANSAIYSSSFCKYCKSGQMPVEVDIWDMGAKKCVKGSLPDNCKFVEANSSQSTAVSCAICNKNFAMGSSGCVGYTTDENCSAVATSDDGCSTCFSAYYFSGATCTLKSKLLMLGVLAFIGLIAWLN